MNKHEKKVLVSIIMPAYNASKYIQDAIDSVVAQTFLNWELIIIDDGSTDSTKEIIKKNISTDSRIYYYYQENGKQGKARNSAIAKSKGEYLAFLDADDIWIPTKLQIQINELQIKNVDLVFSDSYVFYDNNILDMSRKMHTPNMILKGDDALKLFLVGNRIPNLTVLAKKEKIELVNGLSEKWSIQNAEDYHLWLKMLIKGCSFYGSDKTLGFYRIHEKSSTNQDKLASEQVLEVYFDLLNNNRHLKPILLKALKKEFRKQSSKRFSEKSDLNVFIDKNCFYLRKGYYSSFLKFLNYFLGIKLTRKFLNRLLNA
jgi:teichuronic acid biosynthesis glycosyltransferase TuaG